jgi:hypothetical protein
MDWSALVCPGCKQDVEVGDWEMVDVKMASIYNDEEDIHIDLYWVEAEESVVARFTKDGEEVEEDTALPAETLEEAEESVLYAYRNDWQLTWEG